MLHRHRHLTAWLGVFAIWFAIAAPLVSQWRVAQASAVDATICSVEHGAHRSSDAGGASAASFAPVPVSSVFVAAPQADATHPDRYPRAYPRAPPERA